MNLIFKTVAAVVISTQSALAFTFPSLDGGTIDLDDWKGRPVLVVNTASLCGFTYQYDGLQTLYETYRDRGFVVLGIPSDNFRQELANEAKVKEFCEVNFNLDFPMTTILDVTGVKADPFYQDVKAQAGFTPRWNFNKVLLDGNGRVVETYGSGTKPMSPALTAAVEKLLTGS